MSKAESAPESGENRYELRTRRDVLSVFTVLARLPVPITTTITQLGVTFESRLLSVDPAYEELIFDATGLAGVESLDGSGGLVASTQLDAVWYQFEAAHVQAVRGHARPALRARLPAIIMRMQRRDSIRYPVPGLNPPVCDVPTQKDALRLRVIDISLSGIALATEDLQVEFKAGSTLENCLLHLPDLGAIRTDLVVAYASAGGKDGLRRIGCRFSNLLATSLVHLHHYISQLERERLASDTHAPLADGEE